MLTRIMQIVSVLNSVELAYAQLAIVWKLNLADRSKIFEENPFCFFDPKFWFSEPFCILDNVAGIFIITTNVDSDICISRFQGFDHKFINMNTIFEEISLIVAN